VQVLDAGVQEGSGLRRIVQAAANEDAGRRWRKLQRLGEFSEAGLAGG
jgi:hypothetical protein